MFSGMATHVGYTAHLCGGLTGILIGIGVLRNLEQENWERVLWWISMALFAVFITFGIVVHMTCPEYFPKQFY